MTEFIPSSTRPCRRAGTITLLLTLAASCACAQVRRPPPGGRLLGQNAPDAAPVSTTRAVPSDASAAAAGTGQPVSLLEQPPKQATIDTAPNNLTIRADNASLTQTLQRIADKTGMKLEGISGDQRVFGNFGPGEPREVLNTLLTGTGYNIVMVGALDNGAPRQLILSQKKAGGASGTTAPPPQQNPTPPSDDDGNDPPQDDPNVQQQVMVPPQRGGEGMGNGGIRTPQQLLQQMQQQRQQADQQGNPQP